VADVEALGRPLPAGPEDPARSPERSAADGEGAVMPLLDHLGELRRRVLISVFAIGLASVLGWLIEPRVLELLVAPLRQQTTEALRFIGLGDAFTIRVKIAIVVGVLIAMPVVLYQGWRFVAPGLTTRERSVARPWLPLAYLFFLLGAAVAYVVLPFAVGFLLSFSQPGELEPLITASEYFGFVTNLILAFGLVMQYPLLVSFLAEIGVITSARLRAVRRYVILGIAIFAAVVTPGADLVSPTVLGVVLYILYEFTIQLIRWRGH
jgi:sec-independent protein translocase protein TatC